MTDSLLHRWQAEVYDAFKDGAPNGWLIGWDRDRLLNEVRDIARLADGCINATSFDYARCNRFELRIGAEDRQHWVLTVRVSFVIDAYSLHWTEYGPGDKSGRVVDGLDNKRTGTLENETRSILAGRGFAELPATWSALPMTGIALELSDPEDVTLGKCVFEDYDG
ncbi:MAG: hypothetical protein AAFQ65_13700 [Myxococcota bacterium]